MLPDPRTRISTDPDYIYLPRFDFSVEKLLDRYPDGVPEKLIAQGLLMTEEEVQALYEQTIQKLQASLGVGGPEDL